MKFWFLIEARNTLRTATFHKRERLGAHHVATGVLNFFEAIENDIEQEQYENIEISLEICVKIWSNMILSYDHGSL